MGSSDRQMVIGMILIFVLVIVYWLAGTYLFPPSPPAPTADTTALDAPTPIPQESEQKAQLGLPSIGKRTPAVYLENDYLRLAISTTGGQPTHLTLKKYLRADSTPVTLITDTTFVSGMFVLGPGGLLNTDTLVFEIAEHSDSTVVLTTKKEALTLTYTYRLSFEHPYVVDFTVEAVDSEGRWLAGTPVVSVYVSAVFIPQERDPSMEAKHCKIAYKLKGERGVEELTPDENQDISVSLEWVAFVQQFFTMAFIGEEIKSAHLEIVEVKQPQDRTARARAQLNFSLSSPHRFTIPLRFYLGPNHFHTMKALHKDLEEVLPLGGFILRPINTFLIIPIFNFLEKYISNYAVIILVLTIIIKLLLTPLTYRSYLAMARMSLLQPHLKALQEKYRDNPQRLAAEQIKLFRQMGVNPLSGCLPMLLQLPILFAMYRFFPASIELRQRGFFWIDDFSTYDSILELPFTIPFYGSHVSLLALLLVGSMLVFSLVTARTTTTEPSYRWMMYLFPVLLIGVFNNLPAALNLYYFYYNLLSVLQQFVMRRFLVKPAKLQPDSRSSGGKPTNRQPRTLFEAKLRKWRELQKKRQELQKQKKRGRS